MVADTIEREITIDAPPERVWALITEPEHLARWFGDESAEIELRPGGAFRLSWKSMGTSHGRVVAVEPYTRFAYRWSVLDGHWGVEPTDENATLVEFTLRPVGSATLVRVVESGFAALTASDDRREQAQAGNTRGWRNKLGDLEAYATRVPA
jgi:uncharacterized protein YndB with AHSA1/START domain